MNTINMKFYSSIILVTSWFLVSMPSFAASFNCKKAVTEVEKEICADEELSQLDSDMAKAYKKLLAVLPKAEAEFLQENQRAWLTTRDETFDLCDVDSCFTYVYAVRVSTLSPTEQVSFDCKKATTVAEKKICASRLLSHADGRLAALYKPRREEFKENQRTWLKERDTQLAKSTCDLACAWSIYQEQIQFYVHQNF
jgi:uncharacterized protein